MRKSTESNFDKAIKQINRTDSIASKVGLGFIACGAALGSVFFLNPHNIDHNLSFGYSVNEKLIAQEAINNVDNLLEDIGSVALPAALALVGGSMVGAKLNHKFAVRQRWASVEMAENSRSKWRKPLQYLAAGSVPVMASTAAFLGTFSTAIGDTITHSPDKPIETLSNYAPGNYFVLQSKDTMPMVQSNLSPQLVQNVINSANQQNVEATPFNFNLGSFDYNGQNYTDLALGLPVDSSSIISDPVTNQNQCSIIPVEVSKSFGAAIGSTLEIDNFEARIVDKVSGIGAINRVGIVLDNQALTNCLNQGDNNLYGVALNTSNYAGAQQILQEAKNMSSQNETYSGTIVSKKQFIVNSQNFWRNNVKPITNVLSMVALGFAGFAMSMEAKGRLQRNKRQWAQKLVDNMSNNTIRSTELLRATKQGIAASVIGAGAGALATPAVGVFVSSFRPVTGPKEWLVGSAVGLIGPIGGTLLQVMKINKTIDKVEDTRGA